MTQSEMCLSDSPASQLLQGGGWARRHSEATEPSQAAVGAQAAVASLDVVGETSG